MFAVLSGLVYFSAAGNVPNLIINDNEVVISNGYVFMKADMRKGVRITELRGDYDGLSQYSNNLLTYNGIQLERETSNGSIESNSDRNMIDSVSVHENTGDCVGFDVNGITDNSPNPMVKENWSLSLCKDNRYVDFVISGSTFSIDDNADEVRSVRHGFYFDRISSNGFFNDGVVQILNAPSPRESYFGSDHFLSRGYFLGGDTKGCVDIVTVENEVSFSRQNGVSVLLNLDDKRFAPYRSGLHDVIIGDVSQRDRWASGYSDDNLSTLPGVAFSYKKHWKVSPNNKNFPAGTLTSYNSLKSEDMESLMLGIYANAAPCLCTYANEVNDGVQVAQVATTLRHENTRGYNHTYNYFDPDNFFTLTALMHSGDEFLFDQVRRVIERTGSYINTDNGQLPHHFEGIEPTYLALSGETQTGPNTFWVKTALNYAALSGDYDWLEGYMPVLRNASSFVFDLIDSEKHLLNAPGSLMIDVFIRANFTADSNAMIVGFLKDFAEAEMVVGNVERANELLNLSYAVTESVNNYLWASSELGGDHYVTQVNLDGSVRDFVDYDANLIAIAHGVANEDRSRLIQRRVDSGKCSSASGGGPQYVSEVYYGEADTTNGNTGDSDCAMARIGWFDVLGRRRFGSSEDILYIDNVIDPLRDDLNNYTWLRERYGCDGTQQDWRTMYYFEYPSFVSMLVQQIRFGIMMSLSKIEISPLESALDGNGFYYNIGSVLVEYNPSDSSRIKLPGVFRDVLYDMNMIPNAKYLISVEGCNVNNWANIEVSANDDGKLSFSAPRGNGCVVVVKNI